MQIEQLKSYFIQQVDQQRLSHGYLFSGANEQLHVEMVQWILKVLTCQSRHASQAPCGKCLACQRVQAQQLPDVLMIEPEGKTIKIEQVRYLKEWVNTSPIELPFKCVMIRQADKLNTASENALLTLLEEPASNVYLFLFVTEPKKLLPTILSRVQQIHFSVHIEDQEFNVQAGDYLTPTQLQAFQQLSYGAQAYIKTLSQEDQIEWFKKVALLYDFIYQQHALGFVQITIQLKPLFSTPAFEAAIDYLLYLNHQQLIRNQQPLQKSEQNISDVSYRNQRSTSALIHLNQCIIDSRRYLNANVPAQLVIEKLMIEAVKMEV